MRRASYEGDGDRSAAQPQAFDHLRVLVGCAALQIIEELSALIDHLEQTAARGVIGFVRGEMLAQAVDALGQECNLNFGRSGVLGAALEFSDDAALFFASKWHE